MDKPSIAFILSLLFLLWNCVGYNVKKEGVYYDTFDEARGSGGFFIEEADPKTFETLEHEYGKDKNAAYYQGRIIPGSDPLTFKVLTRLYAKDMFNGYYAGDSIAGSDGLTFRVIDDYFSSDRKDIFYTTMPLKVCSVVNFKIFENETKESDYERWATDGCSYFFNNYKIPSDDYENIFLFRGSAGFAKDTEWVYYRDLKINFNNEGKRILNAASFTIKGHLDCSNKYGCINVLHGRKDCE